MLKLIETTTALAEAYGARRDLLIAGVILHDIGKLQELSYDTATQYSVEGNLIGVVIATAVFVVFVMSRRREHALRDRFAEEYDRILHVHGRQRR